MQVLAAVVFGISIALRDGAEKASEYFAGYVLGLLILSIDTVLQNGCKFSPFCITIEDGI